MAYCRRDPARAGDQLWCMNITGTQRRALESSAPVLDCAWSLDGAWIYFTAGDTTARATNIFRIRPDGSDKTLIVAGGTSVQRDIAISPDGATMVFLARPDSARDWQIFYASANGEKPICITDRSSRSARPQFSPDGAYISFLTDLTNARKNMDIWIYNRPAGRVTQVTHQAHVADYCWLSDSKTLVFSAGEERPELNGINLDAAQQYILVTPEHEKRYSENTPRPVIWQGKQKIMYMRDTRDEDKQIWWTNPDGSEDQLLTNSAGLDWLE
jgi:Tol biopolymer transport system component